MFGAPCCVSYVFFFCILVLSLYLVILLLLFLITNVFCTYLVNFYLTRPNQWQRRPDPTRPAGNESCRVYPRVRIDPQSSRFVQHPMETPDPVTLMVSHGTRLPDNFLVVCINTQHLFNQIWRLYHIQSDRRQFVNYLKWKHKVPTVQHCRCLGCTDHTPV